MYVYINIGNKLCIAFCLIHNYKKYLEVSRCAGAQSVTVYATDCGFDPHSRELNIYLILYFHFFALVSRQSAG